MDLVNKGKKRLIIIITAFLIFSFITIALNSTLSHINGNTAEAIYELVQGFFRLALECLLFFFIYKGHKWARITALVLFYIGGVSALLISLLLLMSLMAFISIGAFRTTLIIFLTGAGYIVICIILHSKPIKIYQNYKKTGNINI